MDSLEIHQDSSINSLGFIDLNLIIFCDGQTDPDIFGLLESLDLLDRETENEHVGLCFHIFFPFSLCQSLDPDFRHIRQKISETAHAASIRVFEPLFLFRRENADEPGEWKLHRDSQGWRSGNIFRGKNQGNIHSQEAKF